MTWIVFYDYHDSLCDDQHTCLLPIIVSLMMDQTLRLLLRADPLQDPEAYGEISYLASKGKYKDRYD